MFSLTAKIILVAFPQSIVDFFSKKVDLNYRTSSGALKWPKQLEVKIRMTSVNWPAKTGINGVSKQFFLLGRSFLKDSKFFENFL